MKTLHQAIKRYQKLCQAPNKYDEAICALQQQMEKLRAAKRANLNEIHNLKNLIDYCVIHNCTPTEVLLTHSQMEIDQAVKHHTLVMDKERLYYSDFGTVTIQPTPLHSTTPCITISSSGSMGAVGTNLCGNVGVGAGGNINIKV